mmetsp:Transcript_5958/g.16757  ORF Transcript_5958/g.16757 Transcript_5958/m.16757 type:complete len:318 (+) Transcript_5958:289-1242(+)
MQLVFRETAAENHQRAGAPRHDVGRGVGLPHGRVLRPGDLGPVRSRGRGLRDLHLRVACPLGGPDVLRRQEGELLLAAQHLQVDARAREVRGVALCESGLEERRPTRHGQAVDAHDQVLSPVAHDPRERALERAVLGHHQLRAERAGQAGAPQHRRVGGEPGRGHEAAARQALGRAHPVVPPGLPRAVRLEPRRGGLGLLGPGLLLARRGRRAHLAGPAQRAARHGVRQGEGEHHQRRADHALPQLPAPLARAAAVFGLTSRLGLGVLAVPDPLAVWFAREAEPLRVQLGATAGPRPSDRWRYRDIGLRVVGERGGM